MGLLWLSTVPLTSGIVAQVFGVRYMATLFGIVFLSHQIGSFLGVWLGGYFYDATGSYDVIWWAGVALGLAAALIHLPIDERPLPRLALRPA
jgi:predicted MFS family arabinose efflux permease